jgi:hypothetical protein
MPQAPNSYSLIIQRQFNLEHTYFHKMFHKDFILFYLFYFILFYFISFYFVYDTLTQQVVRTVNILGPI